jgi:carboxyl-terminal processing protease
VCRFVVDKRRQVTTYATFEDGPYSETPVVLLVDGNTASASEILSSAMQDNARAKLAGSKTFGKAVIQTVEELDDGSAVVVTIAQYQTPKKTNINRVGIFPDVERDCPAGAVDAVACISAELKAVI